MGAVTLALLLALSQPVADCAACEEQRRGNLDLALTWEHRAREARIHHRACLDQLAVRTSTPTPAVVEFRAVESPPLASAPTLVLGGLAVFLAGALLGLGVAAAIR